MRKPGYPLLIWTVSNFVIIFIVLDIIVSSIICLVSSKSAMNIFERFRVTLFDLV